MQLGMDQMHLPKVELGRVTFDTRAMLDRHTQVSIAFHAQASEQTNLCLIWFNKSMFWVEADGGDDSGHLFHPVPIILILQHTAIRIYGSFLLGAVKNPREQRVNAQFIILA